MISGANDLNVIDLVGLSKDTKPINEYIKNGSLYLEMDTGKVFIFDEEYARWLELGEETPLPPTPPVPEQSYKHEINWTGFCVMDDGSSPHDITGTFSFNSGSETSATTLTDLYNAIWESKEKIYLDQEYTEEDGESIHENSTRHLVKDVALFDDNSKLYMDTIYYYNDGEEEAEYYNLVITSFTDTVIPENN